MKQEINTSHPAFDIFNTSNQKKKDLFCPACEEKLEETTEKDKMYCIKCQKTFKETDAKDDVSIEYIFG